MEKFNDFMEQVRKYKHSNRIEERVLYLKTMKELLSILYNWQNMTKRDGIKKEIKILMEKYQNIINNYNLYPLLKNKEIKEQQGLL